MPQTKRYAVPNAVDETTLILLSWDPILIDALTALVEEILGLKVLGRATTIAEALTLVHNERPDLVICGSGPGRDPGELAAAIQEAADPIVPVLVLTRNMASEFVREAFVAPIRGFLFSAEMDAQMLLAAIQAVRGGLIVLTPTVKDHLAGQLAPRVRQDYAGDLHLTVREQQILLCLAEGFSNKEIAARLSLSIRTVQSHIAHLLAKMGAKSRTAAVVQALRLPGTRISAANDSASLDAKSGESSR